MSPCSPTTVQQCPVLVGSSVTIQHCPAIWQLCHRAVVPLCSSAAISPGIFVTMQHCHCATMQPCKCAINKASIQVSVPLCSLSPVSLHSCVTTQKHQCCGICAALHPLHSGHHLSPPPPPPNLLEDSANPIIKRANYINRLIKTLLISDRAGRKPQRFEARGEEDSQSFPMEPSGRGDTAPRAPPGFVPPCCSTG